MPPDPKLKEGWYQPENATRHHYYVDGRSLCGDWLFHEVLSKDMGNETVFKEDCKACFRKVVKRRETHDIV